MKKKTTKKNVEIRRFVTIETKKQKGLTVHKVGLREDFDQEEFQAFVDKHYNIIQNAPSRLGMGVSSFLADVGSGKSIPSILLDKSLASAGKKVLVIDIDSMQKEAHNG